MRVLALELVQLVEVPGGGTSEGRHVLYQDHPAPVHVEVHQVALHGGGLQVIEGLGDERHLHLRVPRLEADRTVVLDSTQPLSHLTVSGCHAAFHGCLVSLQETDPHLTRETFDTMVLQMDWCN